MKVLAFTGSMRKASLNRRLLLVACDRLKERGAEVTEIELRTLDLPMFSLDLEAEYNDGSRERPASIDTLVDLMLSHDGFLIASPEHNASTTPALKNAIDWASRRTDEAGPLACFRGKVAGLLSASPGKLGGIRGLPELRRVLSSIGVLVIPREFALGSAPETLGGEDTEPTDFAKAGAHRVADALFEAGTALSRA